MKLTLILTLVTFMGYASSGFGQMTKLTLKVKNATLIDVFQEIEKNSGYGFMFKNSELNLNQKYNLNMENAKIDDILEKVLDAECNWRILGKTIVIYRNEVTTSLTRQLHAVTGRVTDSSGAPLPGTTVLVKGTTNGIITDEQGNYSLGNVPANATLVFSFIGMKSQEIALAGKTTVNVTMEEESVGLEEVVAVGYGVQKKGNLTGSISSVKTSQLSIAPISNVTNSLAGQLPGLITMQNSGLPGSDGATLNIRGFGTPLVIVDGIQTSFDNLDPSQIESISILKDGAASIYGARAGNGVILVTTKRGGNQKPTITLNTSYTLQGSTKMIRPASSGERATMEREAWLQAGKPEAGAPWTKEAIDKFFAGNDPAYINANWYDYVFRKWAPQQNHNISILGGTESIKYFGYFGYNDQKTIIKREGGNYDRYNIQSNIDAKITRNLSMSTDVNVSFEIRDFPLRGMGNDGNTWQDLYATKPWYPTTLPDPAKIAWGGIDVGSIAVTTNKALSGYRKQNDRDMRGTIKLSYDFSDLLKGLKGKAFINYLDNQQYVKVFSRPVTYYTYNPSTEVYTLAGTYNTKAALNEYFNRSSVLTQQYSLSYDNIFNQKHNLSALVLFESISSQDNGFNAGRINFLTPVIEQMFAGSAEGMSTGGSASEMGRVSWVGRLNYIYNEKYLIESIFRADASAKFPEGSRWGYFPSISLGWIISQENFLKSAAFIDNLKIRTSYGEAGNDDVANFAYLAGYGVGGPYLFEKTSLLSIYSKGLANPTLTWEQMKTYNLGLDYSLFNRKLYGTAEVFYRKREGIPATRSASLPSTFGANLPPENLNSITNRGFELSFGTAKNTGVFTYDITANISWSRAKWLHYDEPEYTDPDQERIQKKTGKWTDEYFGWVSDGLFTSLDEIKALKYTYSDLGGNGSLRPGSVKYLDTNNDGVLNWKDQVRIGSSSTPNWMYGFNGNMRYKNIDLAFLFQGAFGFSSMLKMNTIATSATYKLRWTEESNDPNALVPRLGGVSTDAANSDFFYRNISYLRLKNFSIGYNFPKTVLNKLQITRMRVYLAGTNLLTLSTISKYGVDPEAPSNQIQKYYPQQRTISLGATISF